MAPKVTKYLSYFGEKICQNIFQKSPNLVTLTNSWRQGRGPFLIKKNAQIIKNIPKLLF